MSTTMDEKDENEQNIIEEAGVQDQQVSGEAGVDMNEGNKMDTEKMSDTDQPSSERTEYTGEYGNAVEASVEERSSIYSYSYREHPQEATRSGDYYADRDSTAQRKEDGAAEESTGFSEDDRHTDDSVETVDSVEGWQKTSYSMPDEQKTSQEIPPVDSDASQKSPKGWGLSWKKVGMTALVACIFGVVAAVCFQGVCYFSSHVLGVNLAAPDTPIGYTTDAVNYTQAVSAPAVGTTDVSGIVSQTMPSIVSITSTQEGQNYYDLFGQYIPGQESTSCGSGFIVGKNDKELLIATNNHVIEGAKTISVQFCDTEIYKASEKGTDASNDLAVIAVKLTDIKSETLNAIRVSRLGDSAEAKVGEMVVAIGNALGYGQSVTVGYISAKDRQIQASAEDDSGQRELKVIQTDAAINPGNSGGALLNMRGEVIGINSAKISNSSVEGVGYAIPISEATPIINELMNKEVLTEAQKGYLGISGRTVSQEALSFHMPEGVYVEEIAKDGAAERAGIQKGDIITAINEIKVTTIESLKEKANSYKKGTKVTITLQRNANGEYEEKKVEVTLQGADSLKSIPSSSPSARGGSDGNNDSGNSEDGQGKQNPEDGSGWEDFFPFNFGY